MASGLLVAGFLSGLELYEKSTQNGSGTTTPPTLPNPPGRSAGSTQTVTVTETISGSGSATQQSSQASSSGAQSVPSGYVLVTALSALSGKTSAYFNHPSQGLSMLVSVAGQWKAFSATCTHAPCTVHYSGSSISCPCHGGTFNPNNGAVTGGPPPSPLPEMNVLVENGNLYVSA